MDRSTSLTEYDEALVRRLIEKTTVFEDKFTVEFVQRFRQETHHRKLKPTTQQALKIENIDINFSLSTDI